MLYFKRILLLIFFLTIFSNLSLAEEKVSYIDLDYIINNSDYGKKMITELETLKSQNLNKLKTEEEIIIKYEKDLIAKKNVITDEEFQKSLKVLKNKINEFNEKKVFISKDFKNQKNKNISNFFEKTAPLIKNYMSEKSISILVDKKNIFIGKSNYDITEDILKIINNSLK